MVNQKEIRWRQRFQNFKNAFQVLEKYIQIDSLNELERAGIIQLFEVAFELSWKLMKDYLEAQGYLVKSPRDAIKQSFQAGIIDDGHSWIAALDDRNLTTHTYDEQTVIEIVNRIISRYFPNLLQLRDFMKKEYTS